MTQPQTSSASAAPPARGAKSGARRWAIRTAQIAVVIYLLASLMLYLAQMWMIFPGAFVHKGASVAPASGREVLTLQTSDGQRISAVFGAALTPDGAPFSDAAHRPTILFFYGNGDCIKTSMELFSDFRRLGANVLIPEYVGYPMSEGRPSEGGVYATADAAYECLLARADVDPKQIVVVGRSLGSGAAVDLASRKPVAGLATFSAFTSMDDMARKVLPMFPTSLFLKHHFNNEQKIAAVKCPILLAHGTQDGLVPFGMMARLAAKATQPDTTLPVHGADHNDLFYVGGDSLLEKLGEFLGSLGKKNPALP